MNNPKTNVFCSCGSSHRVRVYGSTSLHPLTTDCLITANSWSGWGISKSQPLASKASRLPLTLHPDILVPGVGNDPTSGLVLVPLGGYAPPTNAYQAHVMLFN